MGRVAVRDDVDEVSKFCSGRVTIRRAPLDVQDNTFLSYLSPSVIGEKGGHDTPGGRRESNKLLFFFESRLAPS